MTASATFCKIECPQLEKVKAGLRELASLSSDKGAAQAVARALLSWGETTRTTKILPRTPKDFGNLRGTITARVTRQGSVARLEFYAGGPAAPYAVHVHENLKANVHWKTPGTGPKYIENPVTEEMPRLEDEVGREVERATQEAMGK